ncbi:agamous-like MADS-box protein AGL80-like, partial [Trifolium medium]|nr:agamous-like MADS-box protein AGL80-like [Trifolium medium]
MPRRKIKLAFISDELARKVTYNKRKKGLIKKGAVKVIERYQNSYMRDEKRNVTQERFTMQMITKATDQIRKMKHDNRENELNLLMFV